MTFYKSHYCTKVISPALYPRHLRLIFKSGYYMVGLLCNMNKKRKIIMRLCQFTFKDKTCIINIIIHPTLNVG